MSVLNICMHKQSWQARGQQVMHQIGLAHAVPQRFEWLCRVAQSRTLSQHAQNPAVLSTSTSPLMLVPPFNL